MRIINVSVILVLIILAVAVATTATRRAERATSDPGCTTTFYTKLVKDGTVRYCVSKGDKWHVCETLPLAAIVAANERETQFAKKDRARCANIVWGFGCDRGLLCGLQQSGANLVDPGAAEHVARTRCGSHARLSC